MKRKLLALGLVLVLVFTLTACANDADNDDTGGAASGTGGENFKVGMVTDEGGVNDQSFNQSAHEGLLDAKKDFGVEVGYQESNEVADFEPNFETLLDADYDLMWGVGFMLADATEQAALNNPDKLYGIVDYSYGDDTPDNLVGVLFQAEQPSFLVGYIAGRMTETDQVGFVGGIAGDVIWGFDYGYQAGVKYAANELGKDIDVLSQYVGDFSDAGKGNAIATSMYQQGRDIVFHAAGGAGGGVISAAEEQGKWVIGVDRDQSDEAPENVLTSAMKRVDIGIYNVIQSLIDGEFPGGETVMYGLQHGGAVDIAPTSSKHVPADILDSVEELKQEIIDGKIVVPFNEETFEVYMNDLNN